MHCAFGGSVTVYRGERLRSRLRGKAVKAVYSEICGNAVCQTDSFGSGEGKGYHSDHGGERRADGAEKVNSIERGAVRKSAAPFALIQVFILARQEQM